MSKLKCTVHSMLTVLQQFCLKNKQMALEAATVVTPGRWGQKLQAIWGGILGHYILFLDLSAGYMDMFPL